VTGNGDRAAPADPYIWTAGYAAGKHRTAAASRAAGGFCRGNLQDAAPVQTGVQGELPKHGILLAAEIAQRITKMPFREFLRREVFLPLGMRETSLGLAGGASKLRRNAKWMPRTIGIG